MNLGPEPAIEAKMRAADIGAPTIAAFLRAVRRLRAGERGLLPEFAIEPVQRLPHFHELDHRASADAALLRRLVVIKLNGGLGTSMGLDQPRSLLPVKGSDTFLDFIARQVLYLRAQTGGNEPAFYLMDSFSTQQDTLQHLARYPGLDWGQPLDFLQNMIPKLDGETLRPIAWPSQPELEWCPPGHGDLYPSLASSGLLARLLDAGITFMFASNADNLGATVDLSLLHYFAHQDISFMMEVAERTAMDRKGGHLARGRDNGRLLLREAAQCPNEDVAAFQDIERYRFFNTNNIWMRLDHLQTALKAHEGALPLPVIANSKTVDPRDPRSPGVVQLESAMGAAIECFDQSTAVVVPRTRFAPVKNTSDLLVLRSDACVATEDHRLILDDRRHEQPPVVDLDPRYYQWLADFDAFFPEGPPSLIGCESLAVTGPVRFASGVTCVGNVRVINASAGTAALAAGTYREAILKL